MSEKPVYLAPGTSIGPYVIEGMVRRAEGRCFYLATDPRPGAPHPRMLVSARWDAERFAAYLAWVALGITHPGLSQPVDVIVERRTLYSLVPYTGEGLMVDEAAPLDNARLLAMGQRILGILAFLHARGVCLATIGRANLFVGAGGEVRLFDLEIESVGQGAVPHEQQRPVLCALGEMLRRYCHVEADELHELLIEAETGTLDQVTALGREIERRFDALAPVRYASIAGGMSDVGLVRALNEDNWRWARLSDRERLYVVADGMGGHQRGEVASALAVQTVCRAARERRGAAAHEALLDTSFQTANNTVKDTAIAHGTDMGTTMVCTLVVEPDDGGPPVGFVANVGDSRGYLLRGGVLHQITRDHSLVQKMVERGRLTPEQARDSVHGNILLRTVGTEHDVDIDLFRIELAPGDRVLMCSDGLWGEVDDRDMESILNTYEDPRIASRELVRAANQGGGKDNVTAMVVAIR